jgi:hypothetical protein
LNYQEALKVIRTVSIYYQNFVITEERVKEWALVIQEYDLEPTLNNLKEFAKENKFPPTLSDLITKKEVEKQIKHAGYLPNTAESMQISTEEARRFLEALERPTSGKGSFSRKELKEMIDSLRGGE